MELSDITSALSAAAPYAGDIELLAELGIDITKLVNTAPNYDQQHQDRIRKAADLISALVAAPTPDTERDLNNFDDELLALAGSPIVGGISTQLVTVRVDRLLAHIVDTSNAVRLQQLWTDLTTSAKQQQSAVTTEPNPITAKLP